MAIKINTVTNTGITVDGAYCRVEEVKCFKTSIEFAVRKRVDKEKLSFDEQFFICEYNVDGDNPFVQAYEYLKTLEEFKGAEDC